MVTREQMIEVFKNLLKGSRMIKDGFDSLVAISKMLEFVTENFAPQAPKIIPLVPELKIAVGMYEKSSTMMAAIAEKLADAAEAELSRLRSGNPPPSGSDINKN